jgi:tetratricopeptide (TPR) repeat protein
MNARKDRYDAHVLVAEAQRARDEGDRAGAERGLRSALARFALLEDAAAAAAVLGSLAELRLADGAYGEAADLGRQALERAPGDVRALTVLGHALWLGGSPADGEVVFSRALRLDPSAVRARLGRGQVLSDMGQYRRALVDLDLALAAGLSPDEEIDARSARALAMAGLGRPEDADAEIAAVLERGLDRPRSRLRAGRIAALRDRVDQAREQFRAVAAMVDPRVAAEARSARRLLDQLERRIAVAGPSGSGGT